MKERQDQANIFKVFFFLFPATKLKIDCREEGQELGEQFRNFCVASDER